MRNKLSQLILITHDRSFRMVSISFLNEVWEEREARPVLMCWALSKEASGTIFITSLVWRGRRSNPRPPAHGANALTAEPPLRLNILGSRDRNTCFVFTFEVWPPRLVYDVVSNMQCVCWFSYFKWTNLIPLNTFRSQIWTWNYFSHLHT